MSAFSRAIARVMAGCIAALSILAACLVIPVPYLAGTDEVFVQQEKIDRIAIGTSNRNEVRQLLGNPDWSFGSGRRFVYKTRVLSPSQLGACTIVAVPAGFGAMGGGSCSDRIYETELLDLAFDDHGIVVRRDLFIADFDTCTASGLCAYRFGAAKVYGSADDSRKAREPGVAHGHCAVYLYSSKPARPATSVRFQVDGEEFPYWFLEDTDFFRTELRSGPHVIGASVNWVNGIRPESIDVNCEAGASYFARILIDGPDFATFGFVPEAEGRAALRSRDLVLTRDVVASTDTGREQGVQ